MLETLFTALLLSLFSDTEATPDESRAEALENLLFGHRILGLSGADWGEYAVVLEIEEYDPILRPQGAKYRILANSPVLYTSNEESAAIEIAQEIESRLKGHAPKRGQLAIVDMEHHLWPVDHYSIWVEVRDTLTKLSDINVSRIAIYNSEAAARAAVQHLVEVLGIEPLGWENDPR